MHPNSAFARAPQSSSPIAARLEGARGAVESRFLQAGDVLGKAAEALGQLISSLDRLVEALGAAGLSGATAQLRAAAAALLTLPDRHADRLATIAELKREGAGLAATVMDMKRNLAYLRVFASSIKITGAGISGANREFGDFAQEICLRVEQGRARLEAFERDLAALLALFEEAHTHEMELAAQCDVVLPAAPNSLCTSATDLDRHHAKVAEVAGQIAGLGRSVQAKVGSALAGLQVGDITRQRIEHVAEILAMAEAVEGPTADQRRRLEAFVNALLARQLQAASADFHQEIGRLGRAMDGLAGDAGSILGLRDLALGRESGEEGILRRLEGDMAKALGLVSDMANAARLALELGGSAATGATALGHGIVELQVIKTDVQHMAVNTTLKCVRMGDGGKPLAVIAVELRHHAGQIETSSLSAQKGLDVVSAQAARLSLGREDVDGAGTASEIGATLEQVRAGLRRISETVEADLSALAAQGEAVAKALRAAASSLDLKTEIGDILNEVADVLNDAADPDPDQVRDLQGPLGELLARAADRYTMVSERQVHAEVVADLAFDVAEAVAA